MVSAMQGLVNLKPRTVPLYSITAGDLVDGTFTLTLQTADAPGGPVVTATTIPLTPTATIQEVRDAVTALPNAGVVQGTGYDGGPWYLIFEAATQNRSRTCRTPVPGLTATSDFNIRVFHCRQEASHWFGSRSTMPMV